MLEIPAGKIPAVRMKMKRPHLVPLQGRVLELVESQKADKIVILYSKPEAK